MIDSLVYPGPPRWVKVFGIVVLVAFALFVGVHLAGGDLAHLIDHSIGGQTAHVTTHGAP